MNCNFHMHHNSQKSRNCIIFCQKNIFVVYDQNQKFFSTLFAKIQNLWWGLNSFREIRRFAPNFSQTYLGNFFRCWWIVLFPNFHNCEIVAVLLCVTSTPTNVLSYDSAHFFPILLQLKKFDYFGKKLAPYQWLEPRTSFVPKKACPFNEPT